MPGAQTLNTTQTKDKIIEENRDSIRILGAARYPARKQWELIQEVKKEIKSMKSKDKNSYALKVQEKAIEWEKSLIR